MGIQTTNNRYGTKSIDDMSELGQQADRQLERFKDKAASLADQAATFIRERPTAALIGAVAIGFLVGRVASRR